LLNPGIPVQLPILTSRPNSRERFGVAPDVELEYDGYIDVAFTTNRYRMARHIRILDKSENTTTSIRQRLTRNLRNYPFRPRFRDGELVRNDEVTLRYYYTFWQPQKLESE
jgi:hypothetical protein